MADKAYKDYQQGPFARVFQKHAERAKERILQNLGKADRTTDVDFDLCVKNFNKQQTAVSRLQKEFKAYHVCLKDMQAARKSLMDTVCELYEPCWDGVDRFLLKSEALHQNFEDFCDKMNNLLLTPVGSYISQFPELNNKISKRNRKLLDYDNCRHNLQNLETMKKREEAKITKAKEQLDEARNLFEVINSELHDELPALYDSRVSFFVSHLQCLYIAEAQFHNKDSAILIELNSILESLDEASKNLLLKNLKYLQSNGSSSGSASGSAVFSTPPSKFAVRNYPAEASPEDASTTEVFKSASNVFKEEDIKSEEKGGAVDASSCDYRLLYQVRGTYKYVAEDVDELSFGVGDIIDVIAYDDPEEQGYQHCADADPRKYKWVEDMTRRKIEEGWLMGVFDGKRGLFPANFTSRI